MGMSEIDDDDTPQEPRSAFDPPTPPATSAAEIAGGTAALVGLVAVDVATGGLLGALAAIPGGERREPIDVRALEAAMPELATTAAPRRAADGRVHCTRCDDAVAFASMSLNDEGYFCAACAAAIDGR
jgi:hypothetical protein